MEVLKLINPENVSEVEAQGYEKREAARAVVFDQDNNVALLHVTRHHFYKLPGGGMEAGESKEEALKRECVEEIGCEIEIGEYLGEVVEYRPHHNLEQHSYCFLAKVVGEKGVPKLEPDEVEDGFQVEWHSIDEAIRLIQESPTNDYQGNYVIQRDTLLLMEGKKKF